MKYTTSEIDGMTAATLRELAAAYGVKGRSKMKVDELRAAVTVALNETGNMYDDRSIVVPPPVTKEHVAPAVAERNAFLLRQATSNVLGSASPMTSERRTDIYNAAPKVTAKMARRARKAENRARG